MNLPASKCVLASSLTRRCATLLAAALSSIAVGCGTETVDLEDVDVPYEGLALDVCEPGPGLSADITHPAYTLVPGQSHHYAGVEMDYHSESGASAKIDLSTQVLVETETIRGVETRPYRWTRNTNTVLSSEGGFILTVETRYLAQAPDGTVCLLGFDYERSVDHEEVSVERDRVDEAHHPGIVMPANPSAGQRFEGQVATGAPRATHEVFDVSELVSGSGVVSPNVRLWEYDPEGHHMLRSYQGNWPLLEEDPSHLEVAE